MGPFTPSAMACDDTALPTLDPGDIPLLDQFGRRQPTTVGEYLYRSGDQVYDSLRDRRRRCRHRPRGRRSWRRASDHPPRTGKFLGELNLLTAQRLFLSARVAEPGEVIRIPAATARQFRDPRRTFRRVLEFLELDPWDPPRYDNKSRHPSSHDARLDPALHRWLLDQFEPSVTALTGMVDWDPTVWLTSETTL